MDREENIAQIFEDNIDPDDIVEKIAISKELVRKNNTFKYSLVDKTARASRYETSLDWLIASNMILKCDLVNLNQ